MKSLIVLIFILTITSSCISTSSPDRDSQADANLGLTESKGISTSDVGLAGRAEERLKKRERRLQRDITDPSVEESSQV